MRRRRSLRAVVLLALLFAATAGVVYAGFEYCGDPVLDVGGKTLYITVEVPEEVLPLIESQHPIQVRVEVPKHLFDRTSRVDDDSHFLVNIRPGGNHKKIKVSVVAPEFEELDEYGVRVTVKITALGFEQTKSGESDDPITIKIKDPAIKTW